jgi:hypothetical protein
MVGSNAEMRAEIKTNRLGFYKAVCTNGGDDGEQKPDDDDNPILNGPPPNIWRHA